MNNTDCIQVFSAPGRTELAGNHTDHNNGKVLAAPIQLHITAHVQKKVDNTIHICSPGFPEVKVKLKNLNGKYDLQKRPEETGTANALVRGIAAEFNKRGYPIGGFFANTESKVLPGSGLSSSAALEVLITRIFDSLYGEGKLSVLETAQIGQIAENNYFGKPCGLMDQIACASDGAVTIDFANSVCADNKNPIIKKINFDPSAAAYSLCIVNTGGSHADLTADYASIPADMKAVAAFFGKSVLRELDKESVLSRAVEIRKALGDRALLRAIHFFNENERVDKMTSVLLEMENALTDAEKEKLFNCYLKLVNESGDSSWKILQNVYSPHNPEQQGITTALALTKDFFYEQNIFGTNKVCACRVHGGGFAGTIQVYLPLGAIDAYRVFIEKVFGEGAVRELRVK